MPSARRRKIERRKYVDSSILNDCIYISKEYKNKFIAICVVVLIGSFTKGALLGYLLAKHTE